MQKAIGKRIRDLRKARGMTQEAVAEKARIHTKYFGNIERGEVNLTVATVERIAQALEVSVLEMFQEAGQRPPADRDQVQRLVDAILQHGDDDKVGRLRTFLEKVFR
jgi:transcriptional regulator with XRE-family HTH domain